MPFRRSLAAVFALACVVAGCQKSSNDVAVSPPDTSARRTLPAPCSLLTAEDARAVLGAAVKRQPPATAQDRRHVCAYATERAERLLLLRETHAVGVFQPNVPGGVTTVDVGEQGYLVIGVPPGTTTLQFRARGVLVSMLYSDLRAASTTTSFGGVPDPNDPLLALGRRIAARL